MWEYLVDRPVNALMIHTPEFIKKMDALGEQGWELVTIDQFRNMYFKRPKKIKPTPQPQ